MDFAFKFTDNKKDILLITKYGQCIRFNETDVRCTGRISMGVRGVNLTDGAVIEVVYSAHLNDEAVVNNVTGTTTNKNGVICICIYDGAYLKHMYISSALYLRPQPQ